MVLSTLCLISRFPQLNYEIHSKYFESFNHINLIGTLDLKAIIYSLLQYINIDPKLH